MRHVLATAGHVDHGKSTLVRALTGRDPDRLREERERGLTIELGYAWTTLPSGADVAFVDVPGHQRFVGTMLSGLGPAPAVVFVVAADQGWQEQSSEHLSAVQALGIGDGLLVVTRCDLADEERRAAVRGEATVRLARAGLDVSTIEVSAVRGDGMDALRVALDDLTGRLPDPDPAAPVRLWVDRRFSVAGAGTVVTGTLGAGRVRTGDRLTLLDHGSTREVAVRGLHSQDEARGEVGPVSRVAVNLRRVESGEVGRSAVLLTPEAFELASVVDVALVPVGGDDGGTPPDDITLHVGSLDVPTHVRPLAAGTARLSTAHDLPWVVGDRAILRDAGSRRLWSIRVLDVDPLPLTRRGDATRRAAALDTGDLTGARLASRSAERDDVLARLGLDAPDGAVRHGDWWVEPAAFGTWSSRLGEAVGRLHECDALSAGMPVAEAARVIALPDHLPSTLARELVPALAADAGLAVTDGRVHDPGVGGLGSAEAGIAALESRLRAAPFVAADRGELTDLGLGAAELAAAERLGRVLRLPDAVVLLPDAPARAMRLLAGLDQPFTLSAARQALGTTRRVAVPLLEHLDARGWTRRVDGSLRAVVR